MSGRVICRGDNSTGQLGQGDQAPRAEPVEVPGIEDAVGLFAGSRHTCAVLRSGKLVCWGNSARGQVGFVGAGGERPHVLEGMNDIVGGGANGDATCVIHATGGVTCWGPRLPSIHTYPPTDIAGASGAVGVAASEDHACLVQKTGEVWCWGRNNVGQLGDGSTIDSWNTAVQVKGLTGAIRVTTVLGRSCAVLASGGVSCWGHPQGALFDPARHPMASGRAVPITHL
jgi:alpha-tubulin suppressor-like RCC1 family protein